MFAINFLIKVRHMQEIFQQAMAKVFTVSSMLTLLQIMLFEREGKGVMPPVASVCGHHQSCGFENFEILFCRQSNTLLGSWPDLLCCSLFLSLGSQSKVGWAVGPSQSFQTWSESKILGGPKILIQRSDSAAITSVPHQLVLCKIWWRAQNTDTTTRIDHRLLFLLDRFVCSLLLDFLLLSLHTTYHNSLLDYPSKTMQPQQDDVNNFEQIVADEDPNVFLVQNPQHRHPGNETGPHRLSRTPCIVTLHGMILDLSGWEDHPGGRETLQRYHGRDATQAFEAAGHSDAARSLLVGFLADDEQEHGPRHDPPSSAAMSPKIFIFLSLLAWLHHRPNIQLAPGSHENHHHPHAPPSLEPPRPCLTQSSSSSSSSVWENHKQMCDWPKAAKNQQQHRPAKDYMGSSRDVKFTTSTERQGQRDSNALTVSSASPGAVASSLLWIEEEESWGN